MKIDLNLIKSKMTKYGETPTSLSRFMNAPPSVVLNLFKKNNCSIRQFEKMIQFLECKMCNMTDFIIMDESILLDKGLEDMVTLKKYIIDIKEESSVLKSQMREFDIVRRALIDKSEIIKLLKEKLDRLE